MRISVTLKETTKQIEEKINKALVEHINSKLRAGSNKAMSKARRYVKEWILKTPEMQSIATGGELAGNLGIRGGTGASIAASIADAVALSTVFEFTPFNNKLKGRAVLNFQPISFANLLSLPAGYTATKKGDRLHWLDWVLKEGNKTLIVGYEYFPDTGKGRSGLGSMKQGSMWRVPPQFAGTATDNFITRAFQGKEKQIESLFSEILR